MKNKIQTFNSFYRLTLFGDKAKALRRRGFEYDGGYLIDLTEKPKDRAKYRAEVFNAKYGKPCHVVYFLGGRNMDGDRGYQYWVRNITELNS